MTETKKKYGQFYTTNYSKILRGFDLLKTHKVENIIEPFAGKCDLVKYIVEYCKKYDLKVPVIKCFDIDPPKSDIKIHKMDTLSNPPKYGNVYVITNPPYLSRNKSKTKTLFDKYKVNDLYKCFIVSILVDVCLGGIIIIPLNFWSSIRKCDIILRKRFLDIYQVNRLNIFEERVFDDTSYTVCSFEFEKKIETKSIRAVIYPSKERIKFTLCTGNNYIIGGELYKLKLSNKYKITRWTKKSIEKHTKKQKKCIDDNATNPISLKYVSDDKCYMDNTPNLTSRTYATIIIVPNISKKKQKTLANTFNEFLNKWRIMYNSLFLTNYRESKDISRKRISFDLSYNIIHYLLDNIDCPDKNNS